MRPSSLPGSARAGPAQVPRPPQEGASGSAEPQRQAPPPKAVPKVKKKPARVPGAVGIAEAPEPAGGPAPVDVEPAEVPVVAGSATTPGMPREENIEAEFIDRPSLIQAYKRADIGWSMSREQILRTAEEQFITPDLGEYKRIPSALVGLPHTLVIYGQENPDHNPAGPVWDSAIDTPTAVLPKSLAKILRHKGQRGLMDAGGWTDTDTVCYFLHTRYDYEGISVNRIVALTRKTQGE